MTGDGAGGLAGRECEVAELRDLAAGQRMVTLCGSGGIGKTRLLQALVPVLAAGSPDGAVLVPLGDVRHPGLAAARVAGALRVRDEPGIPLADTLAGALAGRRMVLALDGAAPGACGALCRQLLAAAPGLAIVAAGRRPLLVPGEVIWQVPPLGVPDAGESDPGRAARSGAVAMLAGRAGPGFVLDPARCAAVTAICRAAGGVPLAVGLAAACLADLGAEQVAAQLTALPGLAPGVPVPHAPVPHATVPHATVPHATVPHATVPHATVTAAVIAWSHGLLSPAEQMLLRRLSATGSWTLEMAEQACAGDGITAAAVARLLARLADRSLVEPQPGRPGEVRYRLPGAVREFAAARLAEAGETEALHRRVREYAAQRAEYIMSIATSKVPVTWPALRQVFRGYQGDARDMRSVLAGCLEHGDAEAGLRICTGLRIFWIAIGGQGEASWWLDALLAAGGPALPAAVRGPALVARAQFALARGDLASAKAGATAGLELCRAEGDQHNAGAALNVLSWTATAAGQPREALGWAAEAVEQSRQACDWWNHGFSLGSKSMALAAAGRLADAREVAEAGLVLTQEADQYWSAALFRLGLAQLARAAGDLPAARDHYLAALPFVREAMPEPEVAACLTSLGRIMLPLGDAGQAREYLAEGLRLSLTAGGRALTVRVLLAFADLALLEAAPDRAVRLAAAATALCETAGLPPPSPARTQRYLDAAAGLGAAEVAGLWAAGLELAPAAAARLATDPVAAAP